MIWDFINRRPLPVRDYVVSIEGEFVKSHLKSLATPCVTELESNSVRPMKSWTFEFHTFPIESTQSLTGRGSAALVILKIIKSPLP